MGIHDLRTSKLLGNNLQENIASSLQMAFEDSAAVA